MALINCPECGKEKVSNSAPTCPECGFAIDSYFKKIQHDKDVILKMKNQKKQEIVDKENKKQIEQERLTNIKMPVKPKYSKLAAISGILILLLGLYSMISYDEYDVARSVARGNGDPIFQGGMLIVFAIIIFIAGYYFYNLRKRSYELAKSNFEKYQKQVIQEQDRAERQQKVNISNKINEMTRNKCPHCGSFETKLITTLNRVVSVGAFGLASSKIGKTRECKKCGHKW